MKVRHLLGIIPRGTPQLDPNTKGAGWVSSYSTQAGDWKALAEQTPDQERLMGFEPGLYLNPELLTDGNRNSLWGQATQLALDMGLDSGIPLIGKRAVWINDKWFVYLRALGTLMGKREWPEAEFVTGILLDSALWVYGPERDRAGAPQAPEVYPWMKESVEVLVRAYHQAGGGTLPLWVNSWGDYDQIHWVAPEGYRWHGFKGEAFWTARASRLGTGVTRFRNFILGARDAVQNGQHFVFNASAKYEWDGPEEDQYFMAALGVYKWLHLMGRQAGAKVYWHSTLPYSTEQLEGFDAFLPMFFPRLSQTMNPLSPGFRLKKRPQDDGPLYVEVETSDDSVGIIANTGVSPYLPNTGTI